MAVLLHVDDDEDDQFLLSRALTKVGFTGTYLTVTSVDAAKRLTLGTNEFTDRAQYPPPDFVICDRRVGGENGLDFARWLKSQGRYRGIRICVVTGSMSRTDEAEARASGFDCYQTKPRQAEEWDGLAMYLMEWMSE